MSWLTGLVDSLKVGSFDVIVALPPEAGGFSCAEVFPTHGLAKQEGDLQGAMTKTQSGLNTFTEGLKDSLKEVNSAHNRE